MTSQTYSCTNGLLTFFCADLKSKQFKKMIILMGFIISLALNSFAQTLAFPGAEGYGRFASGGRGGVVYQVTNKNDTGTGSLRAGILMSGARTIVFRVGGTIELKSQLVITNPNITIAGHTAPGGGICLKFNKNDTTKFEAVLGVRASNVIVRGVKFRPGPAAPSNWYMHSSFQLNDAVAITAGQNIIFDHCSFTWGWDENISIWGYYGKPSDITIQNCIIGEALMSQSSPGGSWGVGSGGLMGNDNQALTPTNITWYGNLFAHNNRRNPLNNALGESYTQIVNNVMYNWLDFGTAYEGLPTGSIKANLIRNYFKTGPSTNLERYAVLIGGNTPRLYVEGNIGHKRPNSTQPEWDIVGYLGTIATPPGYCASPAPTSYRVTTAYSQPTISNLLSATNTYAMVTGLFGVGATYRLNELAQKVNITDAVDSRIINNTINGTGGMVRDTAFFGSTMSYPVLATGTPYTDSDSDGMPNLWETIHGLNPNSAADRNNTNLMSPYTNLEAFLNGYYNPTAFLINPGFESAITQGWTEDWGNNIQSSINSHSGSKSLSVGSSAGGRGQSITAGFIVGKQYTLSAWGKRSSPAGSSASIGVDFFDSSNSKINPSAISPGFTGDVYQKRSVTFIVPDGTTKIRVFAWFNGGTSMNVYFDDFALVHGATAGSRLSQIIKPAVDSSGDNENKVLIYPTLLNKGQSLRVSGIKNGRELILVDQSGRIVQRQTMNSSNFQEVHFTNNLSGGLYFIKIFTSTGTVHRTIVIR